MPNATTPSSTPSLSRNTLAAGDGPTTASGPAIRSSRRADLVAQALLPSPLGPLIAAATAQGLAGLWFVDQQHHPGTLDAPTAPGQRWIAQVAAELDRYWAHRPGDGQPPRFEVPLDPLGTPFQRAVWQALLTIPFGATSTYGAVATRAGSPAAVRAAGAAIGRNPIGIVVPCHRVIGRDGSLTGYAGGLARKQRLLEIEHALPPAEAVPRQLGLLR
jgi:methylated-DNA-[protein]-cysteine S-methyltransferase